MSKKPPSVAPPEVVEALGTLERASTPTDLGRAYQTVLNWRRTVRNPSYPLQILQIFIIGAVLFAVAMAPNLLHFQLTDYERGMLSGVWIAVLARSVSDWFSRPRPEPTLLQRVDDAIGRWRHLVPAMRDVPK